MPGALRILHVLRAPVGGLFRHVLDLAQGQAERGHQVGIVAASSAEPTAADAKLDALAPRLALGVSRIPMRRQLGLADFMAFRHVGGCAATTKPDVIHGHGAKGGAFVRLVRAGHAIRAYTPHGGSLHYGRTPRGLVYGAIERMLMRRTELFLFESAFARGAFEAMIGKPRGVVRVIHNGIGAAEMTPVTPATDAADVVYVGELRALKGPDVLIEALAQLHKRGRSARAVIAGDGPDREALQDAAKALGLTDYIRFLGHVPARQAFSQGRLLVVPSRAESLPYIVLEAAAAGLPVIATRVGGIPEIFGTPDPLIPPGDATALAQALAAALDDPAATRQAADRLRERVRTAFSQDVMVDGVLAAYGEAIGNKSLQRD